MKGYRVCSRCGVTRKDADLAEAVTTFQDQTVTELRCAPTCPKVRADPNLGERTVHVYQVFGGAVLA